MFSFQFSSICEVADAWFEEIGMVSTKGSLVSKIGEKFHGNVQILKTCECIPLCIQVLCLLSLFMKLNFLQLKFSTTPLWASVLHDYHNQKLAN